MHGPATTDYLCGVLVGFATARGWAYTCSMTHRGKAVSFELLGRTSPPVFFEFCDQALKAADLVECFSVNVRDEAVPVPIPLASKGPTKPRRTNTLNLRLV